MVLRHEAFSNLGPEDKLAKRRFLQLADEIAAIKGEDVAPTAESVDRFLDRMSRLRSQDPESYRMLRQRMLDGLKSGTEEG